MGDLGAVLRMNEPPKWSGSLEKVCALLGSPQRCRILRELTKSEWLPVTYLGAKAGISRTAASQHIATLLRLKVVERGVGRLYRLVPALRPAPGDEWMDFGYLRLRLGPRAQPGSSGSTA
jgi:DNA-binding transcriptional ArsR family regulator